ncbi:bacterial regulatory helix-turn-helix, lysR family protein [Pseudomonas fluorescens]|uniref:Bacterial regulatory helix-turn-helix, lysR family protein n=1 Tax=Pseudomonas fluorescens TaxID=294 RepID=A0A0P8X4U7_PSEFL|nr:LysR family transcriptional regulator [Pseudomonas fluorescens]KPU61094.1 bacterial regulatory helix-turn-helix, lysR family protein [Pseudomonas fluorescens]
MHTWDWGDLRLILAVAEHKSFAAAGRALHLNHTTVLRRINAFEKLHAFRLFDRLSTGYTMTDAGEELLQTAQIMNIAVSELSRKLEGKDLRLEGILRITTCDTLMASILPEALGGFSELHPEISLEITTGNFISDLAQRHADVAIRTSDSPPDALIGRRIADVGFAVYAARGFSQRHGSVDPAHFNRWLAPDLALGQMDIAKWLRASVPATSIVFKADSLVTLRQAALGGLGIAALPCYLGDSTPGLERVPFVGLNALKTGLWVLTHQDLRHTARVQAFTRFLNEALQRSWPGPTTT